MIYFGTQAINEQEILRIDLWWMSEAVKIYFIDGEAVVLDGDAAIEAREWAETGRRLHRLEDEAEMAEKRQQKLYYDYLIDQHSKKRRKKDA